MYGYVDLYTIPMRGKKESWVSKVGYKEKPLEQILAKELLYE